MTILTELSEQILSLVERRGWSIARAEGYLMGESARRRGDRPLGYCLIGTDDYALGFRAGYFKLDRSGSTTIPLGPLRHRSG